MDGLAAEVEAAALRTVVRRPRVGGIVARYDGASAVVRIQPLDTSAIDALYWRESVF